VIDAARQLAEGAKSAARRGLVHGGPLDCPQYTRPEVADERRVPPVLGGDHEAIRRAAASRALGELAALAERPRAAHARGRVLSKVPVEVAPNSSAVMRRIM
jgi:tRNA G37 N-methylase TrmD